MRAARTPQRGVPIPSDVAVRRLALARMVSMAGSASASVALAAVLYARTGSAAWVAAELFISFATPALASPLTGTLGDTLDRRTLLICSDVLGAGCFAVMALVHAPAALLALSFPAALAASPFLPASSAMVPALAAPERLPWANARMAIARNAGALAGPALGGGVVSLLGGSAAFALNAASFVASAALIGTLHGDFRARPAPHGDTDSPGHCAHYISGLRKRKGGIHRSLRLAPVRHDSRAPTPHLRRWARARARSLGGSVSQILGQWGVPPGRSRGGMAQCA